MEKKTLTNRQREILDCIVDFITRKGYPPSVREIGEASSLKSPRSVSQHLDSLERKGYIRRSRGKSRAIELIEGLRGGRTARSANASSRAVPLIGQVAAGYPIVAVEQHEASFVLDEALFGEGDTFLLRAQGDSMIEAHIMDGDLIVVKPGAGARSGDIVVAMIGDEATVKRLVRSGRATELKPANKDLDPIHISEEDNARIIGRVVGVIRTIR